MELEVSLSSDQVMGKCEHSQNISIYKFFLGQVCFLRQKFSSIYGGGGVYLYASIHKSSIAKGLRNLLFYMSNFSCFQCIRGGVSVDRHGQGYMNKKDFQALKGFKWDLALLDLWVCFELFYLHFLDLLCIFKAHFKNVSTCSIRGCVILGHLE